jgi:hypothetical protein
MTALQTIGKPATHRKHVLNAIQAMDDLPPEEMLVQAISQAAYYRAEARGFESGHEIEDWIEAEKQVANK